MATQHTLSSACPSHEADLVLLHYGDLPESERETLVQHVDHCAGCAGYLKELAALMPLANQKDDPPQKFWLDYTRELRGKLDDATEKKAWWQNLGAFFTPRFLVAYASAAVVVLALSFTLGKGLWPSQSQVQDDEIAELLPVAENLEFFRAMDLLDDLELLDFMGKQSNNAA